MRQLPMERVHWTRLWGVMGIFRVFLTLEQSVQTWLQHPGDWLGNEVNFFSSTRLWTGCQCWYSLRRLSSSFPGEGRHLFRPHSGWQMLGYAVPLIVALLQICRFYKISVSFLFISSVHPNHLPQHSWGSGYFCGVGKCWMVLFSHFAVQSLAIRRTLWLPN